MSAPLKNTSKNIKKSAETLNKLKEAQSKFKAEATKATRKVENQTIKLQELIQAHGEDSQEVAKARKQLEKYTVAMNEAKKASSEASKAASAHAAVHKKLQNRVASSQKAFKNFANSTTKAIDGAIVKTAKAGTALAVTVGSLATGTGFSEAFNMEGYKMQLVTATKDTEKAGKLMANAVKFANSTPFETGEVVEATAKMEAYGISSEKWLADVADMAGATNKSIDQATEAMADAVTGEWERLKEFGIKKEELINAAALKYGKNIVFNKKGQVKDQLKMETVLQEVMRKKFKGGAEAQAKTFKGMWSTITGVTKSALAKIVGMNEDGTIRTGSLYEKLKEKMQLVIDVLNKWMEDGTIEKIAEQVTIAIEKMVKAFIKVASFIIKYQDWIKTFLVFAGTFYAVVKAIQLYNAVMSIAAIVTGLVSSPIFLIVAAITAVVAVAYKLGILDDIFRGITATVQFLWDIIKIIPESIKKIFTEAFSWITQKLEGLAKKWKKFKSFFGFDSKEEETKKPEKNNTLIPKITPSNTGILPAYEGNTNISAENNKKVKKAETVIERTIVEKKSAPEITVTITGDVYGFDDFREKVAEAIIKTQQLNKSNVVA